jgi:ribonuclease J
VKKVAKAHGRVLITTFASNAARLKTIGEVAKETGRRVCVAGRSLERILRVAQATGYLLEFPQTLSFDEAMRLPRSEVLIIATGGQGEPRAALGRIATGSHDLKLTEGDTVIFSSKIIPGNEIAIGRIMNALSDLGVLTVTESQAHVHVSGHPGRPELAAMYDWIRPQIVVPVHGEARHLAEQARFALDHGVPKAVVQKNGDVIRLAPGDPKKIDEVRVGRLVLDGDIILPADGATVTERRRISVGGLITVALPIGPTAVLPERRMFDRSECPVEEDRDDFIADATDSATRAFDPSAGEEQCASRCALRSVAARPPGPARSRSSKSWW